RTEHGVSSVGPTKRSVRTGRRRPNTTPCGAASGSTSSRLSTNSGLLPISGNLVKREWLRSYGPDDVPRRFMRIIHSWDTAAKTSYLNDYSVWTTWDVE